MIKDYPFFKNKKGVPMNRRSFLKNSLTLAGSLVLAPVLLRAEEKRRGGKAAAAGPALIDLNDPQAKALNYVHNHADVKDAKLKTDRGGVKFADQKCAGCQFYDKSKATTVGGKKAGGCQLFAGKLVEDNGWCSSWVKKA